jgi:FkbM family methyltransferase
MKKSRAYNWMEWFFQTTPKRHRIAAIFKPLLPSPLYGVCHGYWVALDIGDVIQRLMYFGQYEPEQSQWARDILKPGSFFLDIGANVGHYTMLAASLVGNSGRVVAFEPSPYAYGKLQTMLKENNISQVNIFQCAAADEPGQLDLFLPSEGYLHSPSLVKSDASYTPIKVNVCRLDSHPSLTPTLKIDLMKIDVEGFEPNALRGMHKYLLAGQVRHLMCEFNSGWLEANKSSCIELLNLIESMGFAKIKETKRATVLAPSGLVYTYQDILFKHRLISK